MNAPPNLMFKQFRSNTVNRTTCLKIIGLLCLLLAISGCASLPIDSDAPQVRIVGFEPLPSEGLELRFNLKLRVQNLNESTFAYDGISVELDLDGRGVASGVSNISGDIPRFSDAVVTVPVSISAFSALRQFLARMNDQRTNSSAPAQPITYTMNGKLGGVGNSFATRFGDSGELDLFASESLPQ